MKTNLTVLALTLCIFTQAQIGGNQLYQNSNSSNQQIYAGISNQISPKVISSENSTIFEVNILNNVQADSYVITLGVNQESHSVESCNSQINERISRFIKSLKKFEIREKDIYIDFIAQTKVYGYQSKSEGNNVNIQQKDEGFEIKKNIIFKLNDILLFNQILEIASQSEIHNIINVEYYVSDQNIIYEKMLNEALKIADKRKKMLNFSQDNWESEPVYEISFNSVQPGNQYKNFEAFETSNISYSNYYNSNQVVVQQEHRKSKTFFFDGIEVSNFDKILNADTPVVGLQYVMKLKVVYQRKEKEKKQYHIITPDGEIKTLDLN